MKVIQDFDTFRGVSLQAVQKNNTPVADLSNRLTQRHHQLYEVWIVLGGKHKMTLEFGEALVQHYNGESPESLLHTAALCSKFVSEFAVDLPASGARFHFSVLKTEQGYVVSAVFGSSLGMKAMYSCELRQRVVEVDDEPSM